MNILIRQRYIIVGNIAQVEKAAYTPGAINKLYSMPVAPSAKGWC